MISSARLTGLLLVTLALPLVAQAPGPAAMDSLLDRLVGHWRMTGTVRRKPVTYTMDGTRTLQRRFVELHMEDTHRPATDEARVFIGVDSAGRRYIAHWLDRFGAAFSIPPATGQACGDTLVLDFPYPDGAFRDTFVYNLPADTWHFRLESADSAGWRRPSPRRRYRGRCTTWTSW